MGALSYMVVTVSSYSLWGIASFGISLTAALVLATNTVDKLVLSCVCAFTCAFIVSLRGLLCTANNTQYFLKQCIIVYYCMQCCGQFVLPNLKLYIIFLTILCMYWMYTHRSSEAVWRVVYALASIRMGSYECPGKLHEHETRIWGMAVLSIYYVAESMQSGFSLTLWIAMAAMYNLLAWVYDIVLGFVPIMGVFATS